MVRIAKRRQNSLPHALPQILGRPAERGNLAKDDLAIGGAVLRQNRTASETGKKNDRNSNLTEARIKKICAMTGTLQKRPMCGLDPRDPANEAVGLEASP